VACEARVTDARGRPYGQTGVELIEPPSSEK
jgi:hypothetical protein